MKRVATLLLLALLASPRMSAPDDVEFLPSLSAHLMGAHYAPGETQLQWTTWIGSSVGLVRVSRATLYGSADVETVVGNERRGFDAEQANYHLEAGIAVHFTDITAALVFNHVSRHEIDRDKTEAVDWNLLGIRAQKRFSETALIPTRITLGLAKATLASTIGYKFEAVGEIEADVIRGRSATGYLLSLIHI